MANHMIMAVMSPLVTMYDRAMDVPWMAARMAESFGFDIGCNMQVNHIDNYFDTSKTSNRHNNIPYTKQSTIKHDTNVNKTDSYALKLLKSVMKQAQNRKTNNLQGLNPI